MISQLCACKVIHSVDYQNDFRKKNLEFDLKCVNTKLSYAVKFTI